MAQFNITIRAQSCYNGIILCHFSLAVGEHHSNKRDAHSQWNKVSIESTEVEIFRVIYGSFWIISICTWSTFSAHFMRLFSLHSSPFFCLTVLNFSVNAECSLSTSSFGKQSDSCYLRTSRWQTLAGKSSHFLLARCFCWSWTPLPKQGKWFTQRLVITVIISTLDKVKGRQHLAACIDCCEWNKIQLQMSSVTQAESMTAAHVLSGKSHKLHNYSNQACVSIQSELVAQKTGSQINRL